MEVGPLEIPTKLFAFIALMAVSNSALINMIMASRIVYGMAEQGIVSRLFARVLPERRTPIVAIVFTTLIAIVLISTGDLATLADTTVLLLLFVFTIVNIAVLVLRRESVEHEHFTAPSVFPVIGAIVSAALIFDTALDDLSTFARAGGLVALGAVSGSSTGCSKVHTTRSKPSAYAADEAPPPQWRWTSDWAPRPDPPCRTHPGPPAAVATRPTDPQRPPLDAAPPRPLALAARLQPCARQDRSVARRRRGRSAHRTPWQAPDRVAIAPQPTAPTKRWIEGKLGWFHEGGVRPACSR